MKSNSFQSWRMFLLTVWLEVEQGGCIAALACLLLGLAVAWTSRLRGSPGLPQPPIIPGLPLLGSVLALGRRGSKFIAACHAQVRVRCGFMWIFVADTHLRRASWHTARNPMARDYWCHTQNN